MSFLVIPDSPKGLDLGIDVYNWDVGPDFMGICDIPNGLHFIYHSTGMGARQGFFLYFNKDIENNDIHVTPWDTSNEEINPDSNNLPKKSFEALKKNIKQGTLNNRFGPYPRNMKHTWDNMSNLISFDVLKRADCVPGTLLYPGDAEDVTNPCFLSPKNRRVNDDNEDDTVDNEKKITPYFPNLARIARFPQIHIYEKKIRNKIKQQQQDIASLITADALDKSLLLEQMVKDYYDSDLDAVLGELQLSFILFLLLFSYKALEHWKKMVNVIALSERILCTESRFSSAFIRILYSQLSFAPPDFFEDELSHENFLRPVLTNLFQSFEGHTLDPTLVENKNRLLKFIRKRFSLFETGQCATISRRDKMHIFGDTLDGMYELVDEDRPVIVSFENENYSHTLNIDLVDNNSNGNDNDNEELMIDVEKELHIADNYHGGKATAIVDDVIDMDVAFEKRRVELDDALAAAATSPDTFTDIENVTDNYADTDVCGVINITVDSKTTEIHPMRDNNNSHDHNHDNNNNHSSIGYRDNSEMEMHVKQEEAIFGWRYPSLFAVRRSNEDLAMTCARIIEETETSAIPSSTTTAITTTTLEKEKGSGLRREAILFTTMELSQIDTG